MGLGVQLNLRQGQSLVMTPQLLQSIRLLQLTHIELMAFIAAEIEKNPLLQRKDETGASEGVDDASSFRASDDAWGDQATDHGSGQDGSESTRFQLGSDVIEPQTNVLATELDVPVEALTPDMSNADIGNETAPNSLQSLRDSRTYSQGGDAQSFEDYTAARVTLKDHLNGQIALLGLSPSDRIIAAALTDSLDDNGYLGVDIAALGADLAQPLNQVSQVLCELQKLEPAGVYAASLSECLALQLRAKNRFDPAMEALINHLPLLAKRDFAALQPICGVDRSDLMDMLTEIRALDPKPGAAFLPSASETVVPDVVVSAAPDGSWSVQLNPDALPRILVDRDYHRIVSAKVRTEDEKSFLAECLKNASWLERSLDQRATTILKVASEIVRQQDMFLLHGVSHLRPMSLRALAELVDLHESTVSRVTVGKYMTTPRGLFELRYFFTAAIGHSGEGDDHSAEAVRHRIKALIDAERPAKVLSDDAIVEALVAEKIDIARRTVAKYREAMGIASSVERRREKKALAGLA
jgi:RNA polymerase sigma-54 factor